MFKIIKRFYDRGIYSAEDVGVFVASGKITAEQYEEITGKKYEISINNIRPGLLRTNHGVARPFGLPRIYLHRKGAGTWLQDW